jgi:hypothetical protein
MHRILLVALKRIVFLQPVVTNQRMVSGKKSSRYISISRYVEKEAEKLLKRFTIEYWMCLRYKLQGRIIKRTHYILLIHVLFVAQRASLSLQKAFQTMCIRHLGERQMETTHGRWKKNLSLPRYCQILRTIDGRRQLLETKMDQPFA